MKTEREIWEMVEKYENKVNDEKRSVHYDQVDSALKIESYKCVIDALLWVLGDNSGKPL